MTGTSLRLVLPDLVEPLACADPVARRRAAMAVLGLVIARCQVVEPCLDQALAALAGGATGGQARDAVNALVDELDDSTFGLQDRFDAGEDVEVEHRMAFLRARAAAAVAAAFDPDGLRAAEESLYEAHFALEDPDLIRATVLGELARREPRGERPER